MKKFIYSYESENFTFKTTKINDLISKVNYIEELDSDNKDRLTKDKLHNYYQGKTKSPSYMVLRCNRVNI
jgi:hypothetical protein